MINKFKNNAGVTLIEMLVVIALIAVLATAMFPVIKTTYDSWQIADRRVELLQLGRIGAGKINREIRIARDLADVSNAAYVDFYPNWASSTQYRIEYSASQNLVFGTLADKQLLAGPIDTFTYVTYTRRLTTGNAIARRINGLSFKFDVSDERKIMPPNTPSLNPMEFRTFAQIRTSREEYFITRDATFASETYKFKQKGLPACPPGTAIQGETICFKAYCDRVVSPIAPGANARATIYCSPPAGCNTINTDLAYVAPPGGDYYFACTQVNRFCPIVVGAPGTAYNRKVKIILTDGTETCLFYDAIRVEKNP